MATPPHTVERAEEELTEQMILLLRSSSDAAAALGEKGAGSTATELDSEIMRLREDVDALADEATSWIGEFGGFCAEVREIANIEEWARRVEQDMQSLGAELQHSARQLALSADPQQTGSRKTGTT